MEGMLIFFAGFCKNCFVLLCVRGGGLLTNSTSQIPPGFGLKLYNCHISGEGEGITQERWWIIRAEPKTHMGNHEEV